MQNFPHIKVSSMLSSCLTSPKDMLVDKLAALHRGVNEYVSLYEWYSGKDSLPIFGFCSIYIIFYLHIVSIKFVFLCNMNIIAGAL